MVRSYDQSKDSSDSDSDSESKIATEPEEDNEDDSDYDFDADKKASSSSTRIVDGDVKLKIINELCKLPIANIKHNKAIKKIKWEEIAIDEYSNEELQMHLNEIIKAAGAIRTLGEILSAYKKNEKKLQFENHPDRPTKPPNATQIYITENAKKLQESFAKEHPNENKFKFMSYCYGKFRNLSDTKKDVYQKRFAALKQKYVKDMKQFMAANPQFQKVKVKVVKEKVLITPFAEFRDSLTNGESFSMAQQMWRDMDPEEKCKFIKTVANMETKLKTKISKDEWKILQQEGSNNLPKKPPSAYVIFLSEFRKNYGGDMKKFMETTSSEWKRLPEDKRKVYEKKHDKSVEEYREKLKDYIAGLPKDKQVMMYQKYKKDLAGVRKRKNSNDETILDVTTKNGEPSKKKSKKDRVESPVKREPDPSSEEEVEVSPKKKKKKKSQEESPVKIKQSQSSLDGEHSSSDKKKKKKDKNLPEREETPPPKSPKKKKKNGEESPKKPAKLVLTDDDSDEEVPSPKKSKVKDPEYPSQSTAHYFMTRIFKGNRKNLPEAYKALSKQMKSKYFADMKREKQKYLDQMADFIKVAPSDDAVAVKKKAKKLLQQQQEELSWHKAKGTDDERNHSSSSSDSDSS